MKKILIVVDMQKDFVDGSLGTDEAQKIVDRVAEKIRNFDGSIFVTFDTHGKDYLDTSEGKKLPVPHCITGTEGWRLDAKISEALSGKAHTAVLKGTFGSTALPALIAEAANGEEFSVELIGLCTDICVISNALLIKASFPEASVSVDPMCCAGVTPELHANALAVMRSCQVDIE